MGRRRSALSPPSTIAEAPPDTRARERLLAGALRCSRIPSFWPSCSATAGRVHRRSTLPGGYSRRPADSGRLPAPATAACGRTASGRARSRPCSRRRRWLAGWRRPRFPERRPLSQPAKVARYLDLRYGHIGQEVMGALYCDAWHSLLGERELFRGTLHRAAVEPREVLKRGTRARCRGVCALPHPPEPRSDAESGGSALRPAHEHGRRGGRRSPSRSPGNRRRRPVGEPQRAGRLVEGGGGSPSERFYILGFSR